MIEKMRSGYFSAVKTMAPLSQFMQTTFFFRHGFLDVLSMMLLGMALYKWEVLSAGRSKDFYLRLTALGLISGLFLSVLGVVLSFKNQWSCFASDSNKTAQ